VRDNDVLNWMIRPMHRPYSLPETGFVRLANLLAPCGPIPVSKSTWWSGVKSGRFPMPVILKAFFRWLAKQPGYRSRIDPTDAEYFNPRANQARVAAARREQRMPTVEQIRHVLATMPAETDIEKRDRAVIAFTLLTGARDGATVSFKLKHLDLVAGKLVKTRAMSRQKGQRAFPPFFFQVGDDIRVIVAEWVYFLRHQKLWSDDDPLFPATENGSSPTGRFAPVGLARRHWSNAAAIRGIFKNAFSFRQSASRFGVKI
jgi:integrase